MEFSVFLVDVTSRPASRVRISLYNLPVLGWLDGICRVALIGANIPYECEGDRVSGEASIIKMGFFCF